jgi:hypothetical protein
MIQALTGFPDRVLAFACKGHVTKIDYETVLIPAVEEAFKRPGKLRLYYQVGADSGFDPGALWDDFKTGMEHVLRWERVAVVSDIEWIRNTIVFFGFMVPATVRAFHVKDAAAARAWVTEGLP